MTPHGQSSSPRFARDLISLASEKSSAKRVELLRRITDAYLEIDAPVTAAAEYLFEELIVELIEAINLDDRASVSSYFSQCEQLPAVLTHRLATDDNIAVAAPMLQNYAALPEPTLIAVATNGSQEHLRSIASRPSIARTVTDVVLQRGDHGTVRKLAANHGAQFSSAGMRTLARKSERDDLLQSLLVERHDLSFEAIGLLLPIVTPELAERLHRRGVEIDTVIVGSHLAEWMRQHAENIARTDTLIESIRAGDLDLGDVITDEMGRKHLFESVVILAAMIGMEPSYGFELLVGGSAEKVLLLLRAIDLPWPAVKGFLELKCEKTGSEAEPVRFEDYNAIDVAAAQRVVRFLNLRRRVAASGAAGSDHGGEAVNAVIAASNSEKAEAVRLSKQGAQPAGGVICAATPAFTRA
jgi:uncharacterized protein DUF2336